MKFSYRDLLRHSGVYAVGQVLGRVASFLLLPLYSRCLSPADYGCVAIIDLTTTLLGILIGSGMTTAMARHHFEREDEAHRDRVWWTGLTFLAASATTVVLPVLLLRQALEPWFLGSGHAAGAFLALALPQLWLGVLVTGMETHLRVHKQSSTLVGLSLLRLALNIGLNLWLLVGVGLGVWGVLIGNLLTALALAVLEAALFARRRGAYAFDWAVAGRLWRFGRPLILSALLGMVMHQADRYFLRYFLDLGQVGVYSIAYTVAQSIAMLCILSFGSIWSVVALEVENRSDARVIYARVFERFTCGLMLVMLGVSLAAEPLLRLMTPPEYLGAASLVPIISVSYVVFSLKEHFAIPILLARRTTSLLPAAFAGAVSNVALNFVLIPRLGSAGAAWATLASFVVYAWMNLRTARQFDVYPYPFARMARVALGMLATCAVAGLLRRAGCGVWPVLGLSAIAWGLWAMKLFGPLLRQLVAPGLGHPSARTAEVA